MSKEYYEAEIKRHADLMNAVLKGNHELGKVSEEIRNYRKDFAQHTQAKAGDVTVIATQALKDATFTVKEYDSSYVGDLEYASDIYHAQQLGMKLRQLEVELRGGGVAFDSGQFIEGSGDLKFGRVNINPMELINGVFRDLNEETFFRPRIEGYGHLTLDSSFKFITLLPLEKPTRVVMEKGIYLASIGQFKFKVTKNLNPGYMLFSEKSIFQTDARGQGVIALELPVHKNELKFRKVTPDKPLRVNGNYVLLTIGSLRRRVVPAGDILGTLTSGVGLVEEYSGTGVVWLAPTLGYYKNIAETLRGKGLEQEKRTDTIRGGAQDGKKEVGFFKKLFTGQ